MSTVKWVVLAVLLGCGFGTLRAWSDFHFGGERFAPFNPYLEKAKIPGKDDIVSDEDAPRVKVLNGESYRFGMMQRGSKMSHRFQVKNIGKSDLELWVESSTCTCTVASIGGEEDPAGDVPKGRLLEDTEDKKVLEPGEATHILMQWDAMTMKPVYNQSATIRTNDPNRERVTLSVNGYVQQLFVIMPTFVTMDNISVEKGATAVATLYCRLDEMPEVTDLSFIVDDYKEFFEAELGPPPPVIDPEAGKVARTINIRAKPGLPIGRVSQMLRVKLALEGENTLDVAVRATISSELSLLGKSEDFHAKSQTLRWGVVDREQGRESLLYVLVKGEHKDKVKLEVEKIDPPGSLIVEVLPAKNPDAAVLTYPLKVRLNPDSPPVSRLGSRTKPRGEVILKTGHPAAKQLRFQVQFAVN